MTSAANILDTLRDENRLRSIPSAPQGDWLDLSSNDYLSLAEHSASFREEFFDRFPDACFSASASRLLTSRQRHHLMLEEKLESLYSRPALLFNSGYHANVGAIGAFNLPSTIFVCDKLIHASMVDGILMANAEFTRFPHNDMAKLRVILEKESQRHDHLVVLTESIFSMDGDEAPLEQLVALKREFPKMLLYVDEAHAFGVRGQRGLGVAEEKNLINQIDVLVGTFGKAAASAGAFIIASQELKSLLINCARSFIFSTALPPINVAWSLLMTEKITAMTAERAHLATLSQKFRDELSRISEQPSISTSQIVPLLTGNAAKALSIAATLYDEGIVALPIRRPTVPPGGERIRFSLAAGMEWSQFDSLFKSLETLMI